MRKIILVTLFAIMGLTSKAEQISSVETKGSWVYLYNSQGRQYKSIAVSTVGQILGYSSSFFVSQNGSWIYLWDSEGKRYKSIASSTVGNVIGVAGDTFTSRHGNWIYTWDKDGKKINTRAAR